MKNVLLEWKLVVRSALSSRRLPAVLACVGMFLAIPAIWSGLLFDDYLQGEVLRGSFPWTIKDGSLFGLFSFLNGDVARTQDMMRVGFIPWHAFEGVSLAFWRPLSEITHWIDYRLWPGRPWMMHVHSILWYGALVAVTTMVYRRINGVNWVGGLAALLFAIDCAHSVPAGWIACRNALLPVFFGCLALLAHDRWRKGGALFQAILGPLWFSVGLLSGEAAVAVCAYVLSYAVFLDHGCVRRRVFGVLPYALVSAAWLAAYRAMGFGSWGNGLYVDPGRETFAFMGAVFERVPILLMAQFAELPAEFYGLDFCRLIFGPTGNSVVWVVAFVLLGCMAAIMYPVFKRDRVARFWTLGMLLALVPVCATVPQSRLLLFVGVGAMGLLGCFVGYVAGRMVQRPNLRFLDRSAVAFCLVLVIIHLVVGPFLFSLQSLVLGAAARRMRGFSLKMPDELGIEHRTVVFVNPVATGVTGLYMLLLRVERGFPVPARSMALVSGFLPVEVTRVDNRSLDVEVQNELGFLDLTLEKLFRGSSVPMHKGQRIELCHVSIEVLDLVDNWQPKRVRFRFPVSLDDASLLFLRWQNGKWVPYVPPVVGESEMLPAMSLF